MATLEIVQVPVLSDNYVYLVHDPDSGETAAVDPAVARPVLDAAARLRLAHHPHPEHPPPRRPHGRQPGDQARHRLHHRRQPP